PRLPTIQTFPGLAATARLDSSQSAEFGDGERQRIERLLARHAAWVTGECGAEIEALVRMRRGRARVSLLANGIDVDRYSPVGAEAGRSGLYRIITAVPDLLPGNGIDVAIRIMPRIVGAELIVVETSATDDRRDAAREELKARVAQSGIADRVRF